MGFFDKAAKGFNRSIDETVRHIDYDALPEELVIPDEEPVERFPAIETNFLIEEDAPNFLEEKQALWEKDSKESEISEQLTASEGHIQDVLDVLKIPATYTIDTDIFMPEDFKDISFDYQVPQGYDVGQVQFFVEKAEASIKEYLYLLEKRNEHIAILATAIDRLQVDLNNLKYETQITSGIGVLPTSDSIALENENMDLKLQIQKLKDSERVTLSSKEREIYEEMRDELSRLQRALEGQVSKNKDLEAKLALIEESSENSISDEPPAFTKVENSAFDGIEEDDEIDKLMKDWGN